MSLSSYLQRQSPRVQRSIALLWLALAIGILVGAMGELVPSLYDSQLQWRVASRRELGQIRGWIANEKSIEAAQSELKTAEIWKRFYDASDDKEVVGAIQRDVASILNAVGASNVSLQPLESVKLQVVNAHGIQATASLNIEQLRAVMVSLHAHLPYLRLQGLQVTAPQVDAPNENPSLLVVLEVVGYTQNGRPIADRVGL